MPLRTPLYDLHLELGARMAEFAGWALPLHFGSQVAEHHAVRKAAGMFDVSHMCILDIEGPAALPFLRTLLANDVGKLERDGRALYSCLLDETGGILDDLMAYRRAPQRFRLVSNAATRTLVTDWIRARAANLGVRIEPRPDLAMLAVQGPEARARAATLLPSGLAEATAGLGRFGCAESGEWFVSRTGYTGEDGHEICLPPTEAATLWRGLAAAGVQPCGLGARDTLRLEAGLLLYGTDMDANLTPLECGLAWTVAFAPETRDFVGRQALEDRRQRGPLRRFAGLILEEPGILRGGQRVLLPDGGTGNITSGGFAPTLGYSIAFARLPPGNHEQCRVDIRGVWKSARVVAPRFLAQGRTPAGVNRATIL